MCQVGGVNLMSFIEVGCPSQVSHALLKTIARES